jgi:hypothetical protein
MSSRWGGMVKSKGIKERAGDDGIYAALTVRANSILTVSGNAPLTLPQGCRKVDILLHKSVRRRRINFTLDV